MTTALGRQRLVDPRNGTALMLSPVQKPAAACRPPRKPRQRSRRNRDHKSIEPIHQAAMAGNEVAGILDAEMALDRGFQEIAELATPPTATSAIATRRPHGHRTCDARQPAPATTPPTAPPIAPDQVFFGLTRGHNFGPPSAAAGEIAQDVGRPDHGEHEDDGDKPLRGSRAAACGATAPPPRREPAAAHQRRSRPSIALLTAAMPSSSASSAA